ncbi:MAG: hypothetical protein IPN26_10850 [Bacteroidetes bacterium]|nr:hypothetical protein [Bacteroidota bacterium]
MCIAIGTKWALSLVTPRLLAQLMNPSITLRQILNHTTKFWKALFDGSLLSSATLNNDMLQFVSIGGNQGYGLGIFKMTYFNNQIFSHGGTQVSQMLNLAVNRIIGLIQPRYLTNSFTKMLRDILIMLTTQLYTATTTLLSGVDIYPNPAKNLIYFRSPAPVNKVELFSATGQPLHINHSENAVDINGLQRVSIVSSILNMESW